MLQFNRTADYKVYAPLGFLDSAVSENIFAGAAMRRRSLYMFGPLLKSDAMGAVDTGLGKTLSRGVGSFYAPDVVIGPNDTEVQVAGMKVNFIYTPDTEAPAELVMYFPEVKVLNLAELSVKSMHNLLTPRGAEVRSSLAWSQALD